MTRRLVTDAELDALANTLSQTVYGMGRHPKMVAREQARVRRQKVRALLRLAHRMMERRYGTGVLGR